MDCERLPSKILLTGGSGLIGSALKRHLAGCGVEVVELSHRARPDAFSWRPESGEPPPPEALAGVQAVVNLAGAPIARRWTSAVRRHIHDSRVVGTRALADALAALPPDERPATFVSMSACAIYGIKRPESRIDEKSHVAEPGEGFLCDVAREWEAVTHPASRAGIRTVILRSGIVLSRRGGALPKMLPAFKAGLGGPLGDGSQKVAWISLDDLVSLIFFALRTPALSGPVNAVSPHSVTNADFSRSLGMALNRPAPLRMPACVLRALLGRLADETLLADVAPFPAKAMEAGFHFKHPELPAAMTDSLCG